MYCAVCLVSLNHTALLTFLLLSFVKPRMKNNRRDVFLFSCTPFSDALSAWSDMRNNKTKVTGWSDTQQGTARPSSARLRRRLNSWNPRPPRSLWKISFHPVGFWLKFHQKFGGRLRVLGEERLKIQKSSYSLSQGYWIRVQS